MAPEAPFAPDRGDGWYFRELRIDLRPGQLGPELPFPLLGVDKSKPEKPQWLSIWFDDEKDTRGEILCSFQLIKAYQPHL